MSFRGIILENQQILLMKQNFKRFFFKVQIKIIAKREKYETREL